MLASRQKPEDSVALMEGHPFAVETKFDGERLQVHKSGTVIKLFSRFTINSCCGPSVTVNRNSNDVTHIYGNKLIPTLLDTVLVDK